MIKGHTEIQLYKDGKMVQNTHDDNMLTNALSGYFKNYGLLNPTPFGSDVYNDFITTLLGGVLLLDSALPEQASLTHVGAEWKGQDVANRIYNSLHGHYFRLFNASVLNNPAMEAGDMCVIVDRKGRPYLGFISQRTLPDVGIASRKYNSWNNIRMGK